VASRYDLPKNPKLFDTMTNRRLGGENARIAELARQAENLKKGTREYKANMFLAGNDPAFQQRYTDVAINDPRARDQAAYAQAAAQYAEAEKRLAAEIAAQRKDLADYLVAKKGYSEKQADKYAEVYIAGVNANADIQQEKIKSDTELLKQQEDQKYKLELMGDTTPEMETVIARYESAISSGNTGDIAKAHELVKFGNWDPNQRQEMGRRVDISARQAGFTGGLEEVLEKTAAKAQQEGSLYESDFLSAPAEVPATKKEDGAKEGETKTPETKPKVSPSLVAPDASSVGQSRGAYNTAARLASAICCDKLSACAAACAAASVACWPINP